MSKEELFAKYNINGGSYTEWEPMTDNWMSVEIYREMHGGELPAPDDMSCKYILDFLDKTKDAKYFFSLKNNGSMFLTAKRMVYRYADQILTELNDLVATDSKPSVGHSEAQS